MMLRPPIDSVKGRKRLGRGQGTGNGCTSGKGNKGQKSRSGYSKKVGFEGGQMPLSRRIPKLGFNNKKFAKEYQIVNIGDINNKYKDGDKIDYDALLREKLVSKGNKYVKLLAKGEIDKKVHVVVSKASKKAIELIEKAGGKVEISIK